jgi:hypothetical protein
MTGIINIMRLGLPPHHSHYKRCDRASIHAVEM